MQKIGTRLYGCISKYFDLFLLSGWQLAAGNWQAARALMENVFLIFQFISS
jgi:hypothetical protein